MESKIKSINIAVVSFRVLAAYTLIRGMDNLSYNVILFITNQEIQGGPGRFVQLVVPTVLLILCGVLLWTKAPAISSLALRNLEPEIELNILSENGLSRAVFSAIGLFTVIDTIPFVIYQLGHCIILLTSSVKNDFILGETGVGLGSMIIKLILGVWMVRGCKEITAVSLPRV